MSPATGYGQIMANFRVLSKNFNQTDIHLVKVFGQTNGLMDIHQPLILYPPILFEEVGATEPVGSIKTLTFVILLCCLPCPCSIWTVDGTGSVLLCLIIHDWKFILQYLGTFNSFPNYCCCISTDDVNGRHYKITALAEGCKHLGKDWLKILKNTILLLSILCIIF